MVSPSPSTSPSPDSLPSRLRRALDAPRLPDGSADSAPRLLEKAALCLFVLVFTFSGYFAVGLTADPSRAHSLDTALDRAIPFLPWTVYLYAWVYTVMFYPVFVVRCPYLFRRMVLAYVVVAAVACACWVAFPVTSLAIRPDLATIGEDRFYLWGVHLNYTLDPPMNCFPSLHMTVAVLSALSAWTARRAAGLLAVPVVVAISIAILTFRQHYIADGVAGAALGFSAWALIVRPASLEGRTEDDVAYSLAGPALYGAFHASTYGFLYVLYRVGVKFW